MAICTELAALLKQGQTADTAGVPSVIKRHHLWLKQFWTPTRESYTGMGMGYVEPSWKQTFAPYDPTHPKLALFLAEGIKAFADRELA